MYDWDEANFAELAREMILSKNYLQPQINYLPFYEKPPLFIWFQVIAMKLFGINEFAARFPNVLLGILVFATLYCIGRKEKDARFGLIWGLAYMGSLLPFLYFRTGLIDPWFNYFMFLSLYFYYLGTKVGLDKVLTNSRWFLVFSSFFLGLAVQTKGPAALIIVIGTIGIYWLIAQVKTFTSFILLTAWTLLALFFSSWWFLYETYTHGSSYMLEFIKYQIRLFTTEDALHGGPIYYHFLVLLLGCFPASIFLLRINNWKEHFQYDWFKIMSICGLLVLILFSIVQTKIIHYSSMAYFPISYIAAWHIYRYDIQKKELRLIFFIFLLIGISLTISPLFGVHFKKLIPFIKNVQTAQQLGIEIPWSYYEMVWGLVFVLFISWLYFKLQTKYIKVFIIAPILILIFWLAFAQKIETIVQGELISFYKSKKNQSVDIKTLYIKSYACFFYADKQPFKNNTTKDHIYYLYDTLERPVFFVLRNKEAHNIDTTVIHDIYKIKESHGYSFYTRENTRQ